MKQKSTLTKLERNWIAYDIGNSAFTMLVATLFPIFFNALADNAGISDTDYLAYWGYASIIATVLVAFIAPIYGTLADHNGFKKPFFLFALIIGTVCCATLGFFSNWMTFLIVFIITKVAYSSSLVSYDSMLPEITTEDSMDSVSSKGYAYGYIGSCIPFGVSLLLVLMPSTFGMSQGQAMIAAFMLNSIWWFVMAIPLLKSYHQTAFVEHHGNPIVASFQQLGKTLKNARKDKHIFLFLLSFFFFIDGVYTIIDMATAYGTALGLNTNGLLGALLITQLVGFPFAILFGWLSTKFNTGLLIKICILAYTGIAIFATFLNYQWQFWTLAVLVGMFQGGIQALSRSYLGKLIPAERSGEYFGLMDICGKGASLLGLGLVSVISDFTDNMHLAVGSIVVIFIIGFALFCKADKLNREYVR